MKRSKFHLKASRSANGVDVSFRKPSAGEHLHHIVPAANPGAADARERLMELGIHPNSIYNGVGMNTQIHDYIHTQRYFDALRDRLRTIESTEGAVAFLNDLAREIDRLPLPNSRDEAQTLAQQVVEYIRNYGQ
ncbi:MAG: hypothetical protein DYG88_12125 [Chloroflexi bacterium CFX4]|nr:hypothetical protein [Chloroflexi bacterium CFX4]MDL1923122.1 hypothetical protein [Chloroflexi bacterium CFX3]